MSETHWLLHQHPRSRSWMIDLVNGADRITAVELPNLTDAQQILGKLVAATLLPRIERTS